RAKRLRRFRVLSSREIVNSFGGGRRILTFTGCPSVNRRAKSSSERRSHASASFFRSCFCRRVNFLAIAGISVEYAVPCHVRSLPATPLFANKEQSRQAGIDLHRFVQTPSTGSL